MRGDVREDVCLDAVPAGNAYRIMPGLATAREWPSDRSPAPSVLMPR